MRRSSDDGWCVGKRRGFPQRGRHRIFLTAWTLGLLSAAAFSAKKAKGPPPAISSIFPAGGRAGTSFSCNVAGPLTKVPTRAWTDDPGIVFKATGKTDTFEVTLAPETPPGPHLVRFFDDDGASPPRIFVVGRIDEATDVEPNDDFRKAQALPKLPVTVNGRLDKAGDADTFAVKAEAGHWLVCDLQGYALGSPMDPAMKLLDERGVEVAMSHDTHNLDPRIAYEVRKTGVYRVQVMAFAHPPAADVNLKGSPDHVYRLTITDQPYARAGWPCAVPREGAGGGLHLLGWNYGPTMEGPESNIDATKVVASGDLLRVPAANGEPVLAAVVGTPVSVETEPNNDAAQAQRITLPATLCGRIGAPKDEDRFVFSAKKGEVFEFRVRAAALHSPVDAWLRVEDKQGKVLQQSDDSGEGDFDPSLKGWKAPADGDYIVAVGDLFGRGGWDCVYALEAGSPQSRVSVTLPANAFRLEPGKTMELKLTAKVSGEWKGGLQAKIVGLPQGVTAKPGEIPLKGGDVKLTLTAAADAAPANQPFEVLISGSAPEAPGTWKARFDFRGAEPRGDALVNEDSRAWLTVAGNDGEAQPATATPEQAPVEKK
jgi:hypothetical protein